MGRMARLISVVMSTLQSAGNRLGLLDAARETVTVRVDGSVAVLDAAKTTLRIYPPCETHPAVYEVVTDANAGYRLQLRDRTTDAVCIATGRGQRDLSRELQKLACAVGAVKAPRGIAWGWAVAAIIGFVAITTLGVPLPRVVNAAKPAATALLPLSPPPTAAAPAAIEAQDAPLPLSFSTADFMDCTEAAP